MCVCGGGARGFPRPSAASRATVIRAQRPRCGGVELPNNKNPKSQPWAGPGGLRKPAGAVGVKTL